MILTTDHTRALACVLCRLCNTQTKTQMCVTVMQQPHGWPPRNLPGRRCPLCDGTKRIPHAHTNTIRWRGEALPIERLSCWMDCVEVRKQLVWQVGHRRHHTTTACIALERVDGLLGIFFPPKEVSKSEPHRNDRLCGKIRMCCANKLPACLRLQTGGTPPKLADRSA